MRTFHLHITGQVQGVGFRPFVYRLAQRYRLTGSVSNGVDGVHVDFNAPVDVAAEFVGAIQREKPAAAQIEQTRLHEHAPRAYTSFTIRPSSFDGAPVVLLTPDLGLCAACRHELHEPGNRRFHYAFTTCTDCGPRYSVIESLPYDRERTAMEPFTQCVECQSEYDDPANRRYYSQTNSCAACGVGLELYDGQGALMTRDPEVAIDDVAQALGAGQIVAVKGIGGFLLLCDAADATALLELRLNKNRPAKPFAVLYPNLAMLRADADLTPAEARAFGSIESPIVLVTVRRDAATGLNLPHVAPGLRRIGAMQPYAPLLELIASRFGRPLVATSGNISGSPIIADNEVARREFGRFADLVLVHDRVITAPQDDSVVRFSPRIQQRIVLRRARGYAPTCLQPALRRWQETVLAAGADLKAAFAVQYAGNTYVSPYLGDLEELGTQERFRAALDHLLGVLHAQPERLLADLHDGYYATAIAREWAASKRLPLTLIQHHEAHFAAVLAENNLLEGEGPPTLGVVWDGTGHGFDGHSWGGELFLYGGRPALQPFSRLGWIDYYDHLSGDKMAREPRLAALSLCRETPEADGLLETCFSPAEWTFYRAFRRHAGHRQTSSMGRVFDGVAGVLGLCNVQNYEGQAAMLLEDAAAEWAASSDLTAPDAGYPLPAPARNNPDGLPAHALMAAVAGDRLRGMPAGKIALRFHVTLVDWVARVARRHNVPQIAFSGGVLQNALLVDLCQARLGPEFELFFHRQLSPNDECIGYGQLAHFYLTHRAGPAHAHEPAHLHPATLFEDT